MKRKASNFYLLITIVYTQQLIPKHHLNKINMSKNGIYSKWLIKGLEGFCFGSDKVFYKLPFQSGKKYYGIKAIKKQYPNRYRINQKEWLSEKQLKNRIYLNPNPELIISSLNDNPF